MTKNLLTSLFLLICLSSYGQNIDNFYKKDASNIYNQTIIQYLSFLEKENRIVPDTLFIEKDEKLTENLISKIGKTQIVVIELSKIEKKFLLQEGKFISYKLYPIEFVNKEFRVSLIPYKDWYNENNQLWSMDIGRYWAVYDFKDDKFIFKKIESFVK